MAARKKSIKSFLNLASSCMYPINCKNPLKETEILSGRLEPTNEGYALSKILSTKLCEYISKSDVGYNYKTLIPCNLYGPYDNFNNETSHMIPAAINKIYTAVKNNETKVKIWGDGQSRREFMHIHDFADFIFFAINNFQKMPEILNVGIGYDYSINDYYFAIAKLLNYHGEFENDLSMPSGVKQKLVDIGRLEKFGWRHKIPLNDGLKITIDYFKKTLIN